MALSRISNSSNLFSAVSRISQPANGSLCEMQCTRYAAVHQNRMKGLHVTSVRRYPEPPVIPLPTNVSEIFASETGRFTPERARDIAAPVFLYAKSNAKTFISEKPAQSVDGPTIPATCNDSHVDSYDCFGAVSLNGTMQSNVPKPFCSSGKSMHLNMPGGQWARDGKYIAEDMQKSHYRSVRLPQLKLDKSGSANIAVATNFLLPTRRWINHAFNMEYSTNVSQQPKSVANSSNISKRDKFRMIVKHYGATIVVFHVGISLISLGSIYAAISSGLDLKPLITKIIGNDTNGQLENLLVGSNFVVAYTIHKMFALVRLSITLAIAPMLVRYLRRIGILKKPTVKTSN